MLTFRVRVNPHNNLETLARYHIGVVKDKLAAGNEDGIALDCTSAIIAMAFSVEAIMNYIGAKKVPGWRERSPFKSKVAALEARLKFRFDASREPYKTIALLKEARDTMAHGQPVEFQATIQPSERVSNVMQPKWATATEPEVVLAAYERVAEFKQLLFSRARIKPAAAFTSAFAGGRATY